MPFQTECLVSLHDISVDSVLFSQLSFFFGFFFFGLFLESTAVRRAERRGTCWT